LSNPDLKYEDPVESKDLYWAMEVACKPTTETRAALLIFNEVLLITNEWWLDAHERNMVLNYLKPLILQLDEKFKREYLSLDNEEMTDTEIKKQWKTATQTLVENF